MHWDALRLTTIATQLDPSEAGELLISRHFGSELAKRLFPWGSPPLLRWDQFYERELWEERRWFHHRLDFVVNSDAFERLKAFGAEPSGRALVLSAAGGLGKSRLLLELARACDSAESGVRVRFLNLGRPRLSDDERTGLARERNLLLIVDDAHRLGESLDEVVAAIADSDSVSVVLATRPEGVEAARSVLFRSGFAERTEKTLTLGRWDIEPLEALARLALGKQRQIVTDIVRWAQGLPLLVVLAAGAHRAGLGLKSLTTSADFRERILKGFQDDLLGGIKGSRRERLDRLIRLLAFVGPVAREKVARLAIETEVKTVEMEEDLDTLRTAGLTVENAEGIRLYPDLFADQVLLDACVGEAGSLKTAACGWLARIAMADYPALLRNLAQVDFTARGLGRSEPRPFDPIWQAFRDRFAGASPEERIGLLQEWAGVAVFQPERSIELARWVLDNRKKLPAPVDGDELSLLPTILEPVAVWHPAWASGALDLLWELGGQLGPSHGPPGSDPIGIIARAAGFEFNKPLESSMATLNWMRRLLEMPEAMDRIREEPHLLGALFRPFFERTFERAVSIGRKVRMEWGSWPAAVARPIREGALRLIEERLSSGNMGEALVLVPVLGKAMQPVSIDQYDAVTDAHRLEWQPDRLSALAVVERLIPRFVGTWPVLLKLRKLLSDIVRREKDAVVAARMREVLRSIPDALELRLLRVLSMYAFEEIDVDRTLEVEKWAESMEREWADFCLRVAREMADRFGTIEHLWTEVRNQILEVQRAGISDRGGAFLGALCGISKTWAENVVKLMVTSRDEVLESYAGALFRAAAEADPDIVLARMDEVLAGDREQLQIGLIEHQGQRFRVHGVLDSSDRSAWEALAKSPHAGVRRMVLRQLAIFFRPEPNTALEWMGRMELEDGGMCDEAIQALAILTDGLPVGAEAVASCFRAVRGLRPSDCFSASALIRQIAQKFPVQVYEALKAAPERPLDCEAAGVTWEEGIFIDGLVLGPIQDEIWLQREVAGLWVEIQKTREEGFEYRKCSSLIRGLMTSVQEPSRFMVPLLDECETTSSLHPLPTTMLPSFETGRVGRGDERLYVGGFRCRRRGL